MDHELPVVIYIILMSKVDNLLSELSIVEDFINLDPSIESEKRLLTNLKVIKIRILIIYIPSIYLLN
jgi:hypothetical protein